MGAVVLLSGHNMHPTPTVLATLTLMIAAVLPGNAERVASSVRWMTESEVRATLVKRQVAGTLPDGQPWTEHMKENGQSDYVEGGRPMQGRWWFDPHGQLCFRYVQGTGGCFRYVRISANCYEHFFGANDQPILSPGIGPNILTNGPLWRLDEPSTCEAKPSV
jgi:hypothetical protein